MTELPRSTSAPSGPAETKFSIDSILQRPTSHWVSPGAILQLQQHQLDSRQQLRNNHHQHLVKFLLNSGFSPPFVALNSFPQQQGFSSTTAQLTAARKNFIFPIPLSPSSSSSSSTGSIQQQQQQSKSPSQSRQTLAKSLQAGVKDTVYASQRKLIGRMESEDISDPSSPRRRQVSIDSTGVSNDSEEETEANSSLLSAATPPNHPNSGAASAQVRSVISYDHSSTFMSPLLSSPPHVGQATRRTAAASSSSRSPPRTGSKDQAVFKKSRTSFTKSQVDKLEGKFVEQKYLTKLDRTRLAGEVGLTEKHVKTWFQNRRTKWKKDCSDADWSKHKELAAAVMYGQYLEAKNGSGEMEPEIGRGNCGDELEES